MQKQDRRLQQRTAKARHRRALETVEKLRFSDNLCFDFAKHGRSKVPMRKLSPSQSIQTEVHAPGLDAFAQQTLLNARVRAAAVPA